MTRFDWVMHLDLYSSFSMYEIGPEFKIRRKRSKGKRFYVGHGVSVDV